MQRNARTNGVANVLQLLFQQLQQVTLHQLPQQCEKRVVAIPPAGGRHVASDKRERLHTRPNLLRLLTNTATHAFLQAAGREHGQCGEGQSCVGGRWRLGEIAGKASYLIQAAELQLAGHVMVKCMHPRHHHIQLHRARGIGLRHECGHQSARGPPMPSHLLQNPRCQVTSAHMALQRR